MLRWITIESWDEQLWRLAEPIFDEAFPPEGRKTGRMIRKIVDTRAGFVHLALDGNEPVAMAVTGNLPDIGARLIDYIAVRADARRRGYGRQVAERIEDEARKDGCRGILIEIEAEASEANDRRARFWEALGYEATPYVQKYRWVPETYRALYKEFAECPLLPHDGEALFRSIMNFHGKIWRN